MSGPATQSGLLDQYKGRKGKIFQNDEALRLLWIEKNGMRHDMMQFLGFHPGTSGSFTKRCAAKGLELSTYSCAYEAAHGPMEEWTIEQIDTYYTRMCASVGRAKEIHITTEADEICLANFSDVHMGPYDIAYLLFKQIIKQVAEEPDTWLAFNGDNFNVATAGGVGQEGLQHEVSLHKCADLYVHHLKPLVQRIVYVGEGNHEDRIRKQLGINWPVNLELCKRLGIEDKFLGYAGYIRWHITNSKTRHTQTYVQYHHHGHGGGRAVGAPLNKLRELAEANEADFYTMGHLHRESIAGLDKRYIDDDGNIRIKGRLLVALRSFQQLLDNNYAGKAGYRVNTPGIVRVWLGTKERTMRSEVVR